MWAARLCCCGGADACGRTGPAGCQALPCAEAPGPLAGGSQGSWLCGSGGPGVHILQLHRVHASCALSCLVILLFYHNLNNIYILDTNSLPYVYTYVKESESRSVVSDSATPWTIQFMDFSRPEYWSGQPFPSPTDLPDPGVELGFPALQADSLQTELSGKPPI